MHCICLAHEPGEVAGRACKRMMMIKFWVFWLSHYSPLVDSFLKLRQNFVARGQLSSLKIAYTSNKRQAEIRRSWTSCLNLKRRRGYLRNVFESVAQPEGNKAYNEACPATSAGSCARRSWLYPYPVKSVPSGRFFRQLRSITDSSGVGKAETIRAYAHRRDQDRPSSKWTGQTGSFLACPQYSQHRRS